MTQIRPNFRDFGCFVLPLPAEDALFRHACRLGVTALAGAKPRRFCVGRRGKLTYIDAQRQPGHAAKAAVYSGRNHGVDPITPTTGRQIAPCAIAQHRCHARPSIAPKSRRAPGYAQKRPPPHRTGQAIAARPLPGWCPPQLHRNGTAGRPGTCAISPASRSALNTADRPLHSPQASARHRSAKSCRHRSWCSKVARPAPHIPPLPVRPCR